MINETEKNNSENFDVLAVTNVQVFPFNEGATMGHMKALAQVVLNDQLVIRGLRVMDGEFGLFVGYPVDPFFKGEDLTTNCYKFCAELPKEADE